MLRLDYLFQVYDLYRVIKNHVKNNEREQEPESEDEERDNNPRKRRESPEFIATSRICIEKSVSTNGNEETNIKKRVLDGLKDHVKYFEENDKDYKLYLEHGGDLTLLSEVIQDRLEEKLCTVKYLNEQISKLESELSEDGVSIQILTFTEPTD